MTQTVLRVYREQALQWWAELWREREPADPLSPFPGISFQDHPDAIPGMVREGLSLHSTRWTARRAANRMRERYHASEPVEPVRDLHEEVW